MTKAKTKGRKLKARKRLIRRAKEPGCQPQFEDMRFVHNTITLKPQPERHPAPRVAVPAGTRVPRSQVRDRLMTAMKTLRAIPDKEKRFFLVKSSSPDYVQEYLDAYGSVDYVIPEYKPTPADISDCLNALSWVRHMDRKAWQILWWRSFDLSFGLIAKYIGRSDETARKRFDEAVTDAWIAANGV